MTPTAPGALPYEQRHASLLHHFLLRHAARLGDRPAVIGRESTLTYAELASRAATLAGQLAAWGVEPGDRVVLGLDPSPDALALLCACSMTGAVFVPVAPETPEARFRSLADRTEAVLLIAEDGTGPRSPEADARWSRARLHGGALEFSGPREASPGPVRLETTGHDLAYLIFTSGTTGEPKGIMMSHTAVLAFWRGLTEHCALDGDARVGSFSPLQFDFSLLDYGLALGSGATLVLVDRTLFHQPRRMLDFLGATGVTQMNGVPSLWSSILRYVPGELHRAASLRTVLFAGEGFPASELRTLRAAFPGLRIINCFGHSESVACSFLDLPDPLPEDGDDLPMGWGHPGAQLLLLDEDGAPVTEAGTTGELYLRADNLFSGYWRDPEATARALVPNPLRPRDRESVFRSGDRAELGADGHLYFRGRDDLQVKVRGNRVELEEVERVLGSHPRVARAAVAAAADGLLAVIARRPAPADSRDSHDTRDIHDMPGNRAPAGPLATAELRRWCADRLPPYMVPDSLHFTDSPLPTTPNGKIDRARLLARYAGSGPATEGSS
ncbi:amino acid adenylation domain-containing protein [Streptomyces sp. NBC_01264]|uniref:amino acid adenylation domain-containing protein n=1 Tax=Streptomyces sp. NBC_01264 TaxID=2903804 RepID=UPI00224D9733|nr:amino acid adenylation domain-containing protein [Streptomyces sp. NBC_01264]MCX4778473.1 amino acid adenylation domain-containing protein [Streptomyces sp. NBC_01264]